MSTNDKMDIEAPTLETADASAKAVLERARKSVGFCEVACPSGWSRSA